MNELNIIILAAGLGTRMNSTIPKVLHKIGGQAMLNRVITTALKLNPQKLIIVYGYGAELIQQAVNSSFTNNSFKWALQTEQLGSGDALRTAIPYLDTGAMSLVLSGDVPLISLDTLNEMIALYQQNVILLVDRINQPTGYGRILRNKNNAIIAIIEELDADEHQKTITEINSGIYIFPNDQLKLWLTNLNNNNQQKEYYLTDLIKTAVNQGLHINSCNPKYKNETMGVNNKIDQEQLERIVQLELAENLLNAGVSLSDKTRIDIRGIVSNGKDCSIDINCIFEGMVTLGNNVKIAAGVMIKDSIIKDNVEINAYSIIEGSTVGENSRIGPYARLRPETKLATATRVGNFVEIKKSTIGANSKVNHLSYIGDSVIGTDVNIGAGSVTCNYDGQQKYNTLIENGVFVGSGTMIVAPVTIAQGGVIAAGSVITKNTVANELTVARSKQVTVTGWKARRSKK